MGRAVANGSGVGKAGSGVGKALGSTNGSEAAAATAAGLVPFKCDVLR